MPRYICKTNVDGVDYYLEWSTVVDAPVTYGMPLEEFESYYRIRYGTSQTERYTFGKEVAPSELDKRMERVEKFGTSCVYGTSFESMASGNRAGDNEEELTFEQIVDKFIRNRPGDDDEQ